MIGEAVAARTAFAAPEHLLGANRVALDERLICPPVERVRAGLDYLGRRDVLYLNLWIESHFASEIR